MSAFTVARSARASLRPVLYTSKIASLPTTSSGSVASSLSPSWIAFRQHQHQMSRINSCRQFSISAMINQENKRKVKKSKENTISFTSSSPRSSSTSSSSSSSSSSTRIEPAKDIQATGFYGGFLRSLAKVTGAYTTTQVAMRSTHRFYEICASQLKEKKEFWIETCGLPDNFQTWFSVTHLHVWLLMVRIRAEDEGKVFQQQLVNHFFFDIEDRMRYNHKISSGRIIKTYMHDFLAQFHGAVLAYDEGMCKDDPVMAAALWRNVFTSSGTPAQMATLVDYVRKELQILDQMESQDFLDARELFGTVSPPLRGVPGV